MTLPVHDLQKWVGLIASVGLPFFNIPLIVRIVHRRSSQDISLFWALGVFACLILVLPTALASTDFVFRVYSVVNLLFFTAVVVMVLVYRRGPPPPAHKN